MKSSFSTQVFPASSKHLWKFYIEGIVEIVERCWKSELNPDQNWLEFHKNVSIDFAVGAPYDGADERGAVYIFHGSSNGVRESHSQVIFAESIVGSPSTFGFSIAGKLDLDENEYPDLVIGAYESNTVVYLR